MVQQAAGKVGYAVMTRTIRDVLGAPESWPNDRNGGLGMPLLRGATIVSAIEAEPDELRIAIEARGQMVHSTFVIADRDDRHRLLEILQPGLDLKACLDQAL